MTERRARDRARAPERALQRSDAERARADVLVVTALQDELDAVLALGEGGAGAWQEERDPNGLRFFRRTFKNERGRPFSVAAVWTGAMGETAAASAAGLLVGALDPACVAMCGICAGRRGDVFLGDVIVADRVYSYDQGKRVAPPPPAKAPAKKRAAPRSRPARPEDAAFFPDTKTYNLKKPWDTDVAFFARDFAKRDDLVKARPRSKESQRRWLLRAVHAHEAEGAAPPQQHPQRRARCPGWDQRIDELRREKLLQDRPGVLRLTDAGRAWVDEDRLRHPDEEARDPDFRVHVGPLATGKAVQEDPSLFVRLRGSVRKVLGAEMEGAAIGCVAELGDRQWIVVKAVSDYADHDKDDAFRAFACRASAEFLLGFLQQCFDPQPRTITPGETRRMMRGLRQDEIDPASGRGDDFLARVEQVCRLREPETARIEWFPAPLPFGGYLRISVNEGGIVRLSPVAALESGVSEQTLDVFLNEIDASYRRNDPGVISTLVYGGDPAPEALVRKARERRVRLVRFLEYQGLIDFGGYLKWQTGNLERDPTYPPALYVDQRAALTVGQEETLRERAADVLRELLESDHGRFVLVLGDFGTGKTFLLHELARRMAKTGGALTPVLVEMRSLEKARDLNALIAQHLAIAGMDRIGIGAFRHMLSEGRIALLFDGFDELAFRVSYDRAVEHFDTLIEAAHGRAAKVVVTSRTQHFVSERQIKTALAEKAAVLPGYRLVKLQPFTRDQIHQFLVKKLGGEAEADARMQLLADVRDLLGLSANPRMLGFIAEIEEEKLREAKSGGEITSARLYELLLQHWLVKEYERAHPKGAQAGLSVEQRWRAVTDLAMRLWQRTERSVNVRELPPELIAALQALGKHELDAAITAHQIGSGTLLVWDEEENFRFIHQSVLEWLVANEAAQEVKRTGDAAALAGREMSDLMVDFFGALAGREAVTPWVRAAIGGKRGEAAGKNALAMDRRMRLGVREGLDFAGRDLRGQDLSGRDLSECDFRGTDLREAKLVGANLRGARLNEARLDGADLSRAVLENADCTGASFEGARLMGAALLGAQMAGARLRRAKLVGSTGADLAGAATLGAAQPEPGVIAVAWKSADGCRVVSMTPVGAILASAYGAGAITLWDRSTGGLLRVLEELPGTVTTMAFAPDGRTLATGSTIQSVRLWDAGSGGCLRTLQGHSHRISSVAFGPDGRMLASGSWDATVRLWDVDSGASLRVLEGHSDAVMSVALGSARRMLASGARDSTVRLWDVDSGHSLRVLEGHSGGVRSVAFRPKRDTLASGSTDGTVRLWDVDSGETLRVLEGHSKMVMSVTFSPDGRVLASCSLDRSARLWHVSSGSLLHVLRGHRNGVTSVSFTPDGRLLATASFDGTVRLWDVSTGACLAILLHLPEGWASFTPGGRYKLGGDTAGAFWHVIGECRFEPGELDPYLPAPLRVPDDAPLFELPGAGEPGKSPSG